MVHTGKPSRGCAVCRRRRIKCDEKVPECSYCIKTKQKCPGYKNDFDLAWRDQNAVAKNNVERRQRKAASPTSSKSPESSVSSPQEFSSIMQDFLKYASLCPVVTERPEDMALDFFFKIYVLPGDSAYSSRGWNEHIAPMFSAAGQNSVLRVSTMAIAGSLCMAWLDRKPDNALSRVYYSKAVSTMKEKVAQKDVSNDEILVSVLLLQMYEVMLGRSARYAAPTAHLHGAIALIRHRGVKNFRSKVSRELLFEVRSQLITEAYRTNKPLSPDVTSWSEELSDADLSPIYRLDSINVHLANINAWVMRSFTRYPDSTRGTEHAFPMMPSVQFGRSVPGLPETFTYDHTIVGDTTFDSVTASVLLDETCKLEEKLIAWSLSLDPEWYPVRVVGDQCFPKTIPRYQDWTEVFYNVHIARTWNWYHVSRIRALVIKYALLGKVEQSHPPSDYSSPISACGSDQAFDTQAQSPKQAVIAAIQVFVDQICATIPYYLGSRLKPGRIGDRSVDYPHLPGQPVLDDHYQSGPAMAGWQLLGPLSYILSLQVPLREGQKAWVGSQMLRISLIYNMGKI